MRTACYGADRICVVLLLTAICVLLQVGIAGAHGVDLTVETVSGVAVTAAYSTGEPLAGAQVSVFSPEDPASPWLTGACDESGRFFFIPDYNLPGIWDIQVRQAGHGGLTRVEVGQEGIAPPATTGLSTMQKALVTLSTIWGFVGTALFFSRRKGHASS